MRAFLVFWALVAFVAYAPHGVLIVLLALLVVGAITFGTYISRV